MKNKLLVLFCTLSLVILPSCGPASAPIDNISSEESAAVLTTENIENNDISSITEDADTSVTVESAEAVSSIVITIENDCGADLGMISTVDPNTNEQYNISGLPAGEKIVIEWPTFSESFPWAVYDADGNKLLEATSDTTKASERITLVLKGEGSISDVTTYVDDEAP